MSLYQLVPIRGAELLQVTASHDLLLAEHTLHTVGEGERGHNMGNTRKNLKILKIALENIYYSVSEGYCNNNRSDMEQSC